MNTFSQSWLIAVRAWLTYSYRLKKKRKKERKKRFGLFPSNDSQKRKTGVTCRCCFRLLIANVRRKKCESERGRKKEGERSLAWWTTSWQPLMVIGRFISNADAESSERERERERGRKRERGQEKDGGSAGGNAREKLERETGWKRFDVTDNATDIKLCRIRGEVLSSMKRALMKIRKIRAYIYIYMKGYALQMRHVLINTNASLFTKGILRTVSIGNRSTIRVKNLPDGNSRNSPRWIFAYI